MKEALEKAKELFNSIICHRVEGTEFFNAREILDVICKEAMEGYHICENAIEKETE